MDKLTTLATVMDALINSEGLRKSLHIEQITDRNHDAHLELFIESLVDDGDEAELLWRIKRFEDKRYESLPETCLTWFMVYAGGMWRLYFDQANSKRIVMETKHPRQMMRRLRRIDLIGDF